MLSSRSDSSRRSAASISGVGSRGLAHHDHDRCQPRLNLGEHPAVELELAARVRLRADSFDRRSLSQRRRFSVAPDPRACHRRWLGTAADLRAAVHDAGLTIREWREGQEVVASIAEAATSEPPPSPRHALDLGLLMPNYAARMASMGRNVAEARVALTQVAEQPA
jgi:hypothetical protein